MEQTQLFGSIAEFYEYSMKLNCDYSAWANYVVNRIKNVYPSAKSGLDFACGSGYFTRALKRAGYDVIGVDVQPEMLTQANVECNKEKLAIPFMLGDMLNFKTLKKVDFITVVNDGINCIAPDKLKKVFLNFSKSLKVGGVLHFDVSTEYKLKNVIANNTFCEDDDDYSYIWFNTLYENYVKMEMSVFLKNGEIYVKRESVLLEYIHSLPVLENLLIECGFKVINVEGELGQNWSDTCERLNITAVKL